MLAIPYVQDTFYVYHFVTNTNKKGKNKTKPLYYKINTTSYIHHRVYLFDLIIFFKSNDSRTSSSLK